MDDPRDILKAAGVECAEVDAWADDVFTGEFSAMQTVPEALSIIGPLREVVVTSNDAIRALVQLVVKYKWQRDATVTIAGYNEEEAQELLDEVDLEWHEEERRRS